MSVRRQHGAIDGFALMLQIAASPMVHGFKDRPDTVAQLGQGVVDPWGDDGMDCAPDESVGLQLAQLLGEHFGCGLRYFPAKLRKTERFACQFPKNQCLVLSTYQIKRGFYRTTGFGSVRRVL